VNLVETGTLLAFAAAFDNRKADPVVAVAWQSVLADVEYADARQAVADHQTGPLRGEYLTVGHIVDAVRVANRQTPKLVAADVRAARARGIVPSDWSESEPLPADAAARLRAARDADRETAVSHAELVAVGAGPVDVPDLKGPDDVR
jgi:hypothetical protein